MRTHRLYEQWEKQYFCPCHVMPWHIPNVNHVPFFPESDSLTNISFVFVFVGFIQFQKLMLISNHTDMCICAWKTELNYINLFFCSYLYKAQVFKIKSYNSKIQDKNVNYNRKSQSRIECVENVLPQSNNLFCQQMFW